VTCFKSSKKKGVPPGVRFRFHRFSARGLTRVQSCGLSLPVLIGDSSNWLPTAHRRRGARAPPPANARFFEKLIMSFMRTSRSSLRQKSCMTGETPAKNLRGGYSFRFCVGRHGFGLPQVIDSVVKKSRQTTYVRSEMELSYICPPRWLLGIRFDPGEWCCLITPGRNSRRAGDIAKQVFHANIHS
jgi:hypothetical protein